MKIRKKDFNFLIDNCGNCWDDLYEYDELLKEYKKIEKRYKKYIKD